MLKTMVKQVTSVSLALTLLAGCAGNRQAAPQFWPAPPDPPRVQFLKKIADSTDVEGAPSLSLIDLGKDEKKLIPIVKPFGVAVRKGKVYLVDTVLAQVIIFDLPGKKVETLAGNKGPGQLRKPINLAVDDDGNIYVCDSSQHKVLKYGPGGEYLAAIGEDFKKPVAVQVDDLYLYVLDNGRGLVKILDRTTGALVRELGQEGDPKGHLFTPLGMGLDGKGGVYVTNMDGRIVHFDRDGHPLRMFGSLGTGLSEFTRPRSIAFDQDRNMYVVDAATQNVRIMNENFQLLMSFGEPGTPGSLNVPAGIAVSSDNLDYYQKLSAPDFVLDRVLFVVSQVGEDKISIYGVGRKKGVDYDLMLKERLDQVKKKEEALTKEQEQKKRDEEKKREAAAKEQKGAEAAR